MHFAIFILAVWASGPAAVASITVSSISAPSIHPDQAVASSPRSLSAHRTELPADLNRLFSPRTTVPPMRHHLDLRQKCFNDQGFSVNCATWTGYRYTWGPLGNPYAGGPGEGGGGSGGGSGDGIISAARSGRGFRIDIIFLAITAPLLVFLAIF